MLSDQMENIKIIVGKHCMEHSEIILPLSSKYTLISTDLAIAECRCIYPTCIQSISLSPKEMTEFLSLFQENPNLQKLGFSESSLLFVGSRRKIAIAVTDNLTENVCKQLGIEIFKVELNNLRFQKNEGEMVIKTARPSRLSEIIRAACL